MPFLNMITGKSYIGFELKASGTDRFRSLNAASNTENPWEFIAATIEEAEEAVQKASACFSEYRNTDKTDRRSFLLAIKRELEDCEDLLLDVFCFESSLPRSRGKIELQRTRHQLQLFANLLEQENFPGKYTEESVDSKPNLFKTQQALGPIAVFGSSNFPFAYSTIGGDSASALAAGCPVIVKAHPLHPGTGELVAGCVVRAAKDTKMPDGVFSNLNAIGYELGSYLVKHPKVKGVGFTGSIAGGRALFDLAAGRAEPIPVFAEMGSMNPVILHVSALKGKLDFWVDKYADSITSGTGQFCTNPGLLIGLSSQEFDGFLKKLALKLEAMKPESMLHPSLWKNFESNKELVLGQKGVERLNTLKTDKENYADRVVASTSGKEFIENPAMHREVFGPFTLAVACETESEMIDVIKSLEGQLTGTIVADEVLLSNLEPFVEALSERVGRIIFNGVPTGVEVCEAMHHGGPYPATTDSRFTAVGPHAVKRWLRPITFQNFPKEYLASKKG